MANDPNTVEVKILDKDYIIACPQEAEPGLRHVANRLDQKMREIRNSGKVYGAEKIAVMAALNLTYELSEDAHMPAAAQQHMAEINNKLDSILSSIK